jgi:hypothetical protein
LLVFSVPVYSARIRFQSCGTDEVRACKNILLVVLFGGRGGGGALLVDPGGIDRVLTKTPGAADLARMVLASLGERATARGPVTTIFVAIVIVSTLITVRAAAPETGQRSGDAAGRRVAGVPKTRDDTQIILVPKGVARADRMRRRDGSDRATAGIERGGNNEKSTTRGILAGTRPPRKIFFGTRFLMIVTLEPVAR